MSLACSICGQDRDYYAPPCPAPACVAQRAELRRCRQTERHHDRSLVRMWNRAVPAPLRRGLYAGRCLLRAGRLVLLWELRCAEVWHSWHVSTGWTVYRRLRVAVLFNGRRRDRWPRQHTTPIYEACV